jgi:hypothetical protein
MQLPRALRTIVFCAGLGSPWAASAAGNTTEKPRGIQIVSQRRDYKIRSNLGQPTKLTFAVTFRGPHAEADALALALSRLKVTVEKERTFRRGESKYTVSIGDSDASNAR